MFVRACAEAPLVTGGSGIAIGLPANFIACGLATGKTPSFSGIAGPEALLAGSCSAATRGKIAVHAKGHPVLALSAADVMGGNISLAGILAFLHEHRGRKPLVYSSGVPEEVAAAQRLYGSEALASRLDALFAAIARQAVASGVTRLIVAGGETSGAVAQALNLDEFSIGPEIDPGVPILFNHAHGIALALKSGNFGRSSFFEHAADALEGKM